MGFLLVGKSFVFAFLFASTVFFVVTLVSLFFLKRIFPPEIQDCAAEAAKARYNAL
jgi:hypothetical protein